MVVFFILLALAASAHAQSAREQLQQMVEQLQKTPNDNALRERIIKLGAEIKPAPAIPEEARRSYIEGVTIVKSAKDAGSQKLAIASFNEALKIAPWWGDAYYNLAVTQELTGQLTQAEQTLKWFILSSPGESEARDAQDRVYAIGAKRKLAAADAEATRLATSKKSPAGNWKVFVQGSPQRAGMSASDGGRWTFDFHYRFEMRGDEIVVYKVVDSDEPGIDKSWFRRNGGKWLGKGDEELF